MNIFSKLLLYNTKSVPTRRMKTVIALLFFGFGLGCRFCPSTLLVGVFPLVGVAPVTPLRVPVFGHVG